MRRALTALAIVTLLLTTIAGPAAGAAVGGVGTADAPADVSGVEFIEPFAWHDGADSDMMIGCYPKPETCGP